MENKLLSKTHQKFVKKSHKIQRKSQIFANRKSCVMQEREEEKEEGVAADDIPYTEYSCRVLYLKELNLA